LDFIVLFSLSLSPARDEKEEEFGYVSAKGMVPDSLSDDIIQPGGDLRAKMTASTTKGPALHKG
jgi:hypothetical protein